MTVLQSHSQKWGNQRLFFFVLDSLRAKWLEWESKIKAWSAVAPISSISGCGKPPAIPNQKNPYLPTLTNILDSNKHDLESPHVFAYPSSLSLAAPLFILARDVESRFECFSAKAEVGVSGISFRPCLLRGPGTRINENRNLLKWDPNLSRLQLLKDSVGRIEIWVCAV